MFESFLNSTAISQKLKFTGAEGDRNGWVEGGILRISNQKRRKKYNEEPKETTKNAGQFSLMPSHSFYD